jgi:hypothetical protein
MIDGGNSECREIVVQLHIIAGWLGAEARLLGTVVLGGKLLYCTSARHLYSTCRRCTWD